MTLTLIVTLKLDFLLISTLCTVFLDQINPLLPNSHYACIMVGKLKLFNMNDLDLDLDLELSTLS